MNHPKTSHSAQLGKNPPQSPFMEGGGLHCFWLHDCKQLDSLEWDRDGVEIDLLLWQNGTLYPIEIKKHADPDKRDCQSFAILDKMHGVKRGAGGVVCLYDAIIPLTERDRTIPAWMI